MKDDIIGSQSSSQRPKTDSWAVSAAPIAKVTPAAARQKISLICINSRIHRGSCAFIVRRASRHRLEAFVQDNLEDRIRERAHAIWEAQGHPEGLADEHWRQAVEEVAQVDKLAQLPPPIATGAAAKALTKRKASKTTV
ncbi:DUF2934 domain-containing protein [Sphingobium sp. AP50]|uniref:DUF2934 domain-containing protein n=1 Tax=Sphingobium sp. AP50 TaxID=1884369 RepID=UPI001C434B4C|nr:DUF2934 domain-containing protein [Sphingobium sp. AP50]